MSFMIDSAAFPSVRCPLFARPTTMLRGSWTYTAGHTERPAGRLANPHRYVRHLPTLPERLQGAHLFTVWSI